MFNEWACREDWEGLDLQSFKNVFPALHGAGVAPKHIPNVVMRSLCDDSLKIQEAKSQTLTQCFDEQVHHRMLHAPTAPAAQNKAPPPMVGLDHSDVQVWALAKDMHKTWPAVVGKRKNYAWLNALGMNITSVHDTKKG